MKGCVQLMHHGGIECDREVWCRRIETKKTQQIALTSYAILCYRRQASNATQFYVCTLYVVRAMILHFHFFVRWCVVIGLCSFYVILGFGYSCVCRCTYRINHQSGDGIFSFVFLRISFWRGHFARTIFVFSISPYPGLQTWICRARAMAHVNPLNDFRYRNVALSMTIATFIHPLKCNSVAWSLHV